MVVDQQGRQDARRSHRRARRQATRARSDRRQALSASRVLAYQQVTAALAALDDRALLDKLVTPSFEIAGTSVFAKQIALTELERAHPRSTANLFALPTHYQYGIGSAGFGVWRELAAHELTTSWVLQGACEHFPLLYHWRVLETQQRRWELPDWGSPAIAARHDAIMRATSSVVVFLEYVPHTLHDWLAAGNPVAPVDTTLREIVSFLRAHELLHFDAHFQNVLTDGERIYFTDFGLATSPRFELSSEEHAFYHQHLLYDAYLTMAQLSPYVPAYAPVADVMYGFYERLRADKSTLFPAAELARLTN